MTDSKKALATALNTGNVEAIDNMIQAQIDAIAGDTDMMELWNVAPELAARLAFDEIERAWMEQAAAGLYQGRCPSRAGFESAPVESGIWN